MQPLEAAELKAFIVALSQLDAPLPEAVQSQINAINIPADIAKLDTIAKGYPPLATFYKQAWEYLDGVTTTRSKGVDVVPASVANSLNTEIDNSSREIEDALVEFEQKVDNNKLAIMAIQILQALNPVKMAKDIITNIRS